MSGTELIGHLRGRAEMLRASMIAVTPDVMVEGADRWVLASLLQKGVRRGRCELALGASLKLLELDPSRLWRRLMTVALEDVGVGDLDVALDLVAISALPVARRLLGGSRASLEILIPLACRAMKDRTADHLASLVRWRGLSTDHGRVGEGEAMLSLLSSHPRAPASSAGIRLHQPAEGLPEIVSVDGQGIDAPGYQLRQMPAVQPRYSVAEPTWQDHVYAAFALGGAWERGKLKLEEVLEHFGRQGAPLALLEACGAYGRRCGDGLFIYALTAWMIWKKQNPEPLALARQGLQGQDLGGVPDYGLDPLRTRLGRRAVELWLRSYLEKVPFDGRQVMAGLWNGEAALCNQTLFWEAGGEIQRAAYQADLLVQGLALERHGELLGWIAQERAVLLCARQMVWQSHVRSLRQPATRRVSPGRWHFDDGGGGGGISGGGSGIGTAMASGIAPSESSTGNKADSSSGHSATDGGRSGIVAQSQDAAGAVQTSSWPDDAWDDDGGDRAAHHAIHTPYLTDEELCLAQS